MRQIWKRKVQQRNIRFRAKIQLMGKGGHSSVPFRTHNPIIAGNELMQILMDKLWFEFDSFDDVVLLPVEMDSGSRHNVIPDEALLVYYGECRGEEAYRHLQAIMKESLQAAELAYKVNYRITFHRIDLEGVTQRAAKKREARKEEHRAAVRSRLGIEESVQEKAEAAADQAAEEQKEGGR
jgi:metal-dependent amidase/aminoacylase/carboxypeptidase family protein